MVVMPTVLLMSLMLVMVRFIITDSLEPSFHYHASSGNRYLDSRPCHSKYLILCHASLIISGVGGGLIHFMASLVAPPDGSARRSPLTSTSSLSTTATSDGISVAFVLMMIGRILNGFGAANEALRDAYLSDTIPNEPFTSTLLLINIARILGMALSPGFQFLLDKVNFTISIPPWLRPISA